MARSRPMVIAVAAAALLAVVILQTRSTGGQTPGRSAVQIAQADAPSASAADCAPGIIQTIAGSGDGAPAAKAYLEQVSDLALGPDGSLYAVERYLGRVRRISPDGTVTTIAGDGSGRVFGPDVSRFRGDGHRATEAAFDEPGGLAVAPDGTVYIADTGNHRIRKVDRNGIIATVVGDGWTAPPKEYHRPGEVGRFAGDGGPAAKASLYSPVDLALGPDGSLYIADGGNGRVRKVDPAGVITTVAGNGEKGYSGDGGPATQAGLAGPYELALGPDGALYIIEGITQRLRKVCPPVR